MHGFTQFWSILIWTFQFPVHIWPILPRMSRAEGAKFSTEEVESLIVPKKDSTATMIWVSILIHPREHPVTSKGMWNKISKINQGSRLMCCTSTTRSSLVDAPFARPTRRPHNGYSGSSSPSTLDIPLQNLRPNLFVVLEWKTLTTEMLLWATRTGYSNHRKRNKRWEQKQQIVHHCIHMQSGSSWQVESPVGQDLPHLQRQTNRSPQ